MTEGTKPLEINIGRESPLVLTLTEAGSWIDAQLETWAWLDDESVNAIRAHTNNFPRVVLNELNTVKTAIDAWRSNPEQREAINNAIRTAYAKRRIPLPSDPIVNAILKTNELLGPAAAAAQLAATQGMVRFPGDNQIPYSVLQGLVAAATNDLGVSPEIPKGVQTGLRDLQTQFGTHLAETKLTFEEQKARFEEVITLSQAKLNETDTEIRKTWTDKIAESIASIQATEAAYREKMRLQASVDYWSKQAQEHKERSKTYRTVLLIYAVSVALLFLIALSKAPALLTFDSTKTSFVLALVASVIVLVSSALFWAGRVFVRLYLSAHHLHVDSEERVVMLMTFLALVQEGKLEDTERTLVLTPLFRPSSDGIVKDEGGPDLSLAALISRLLQAVKSMPSGYDKSPIGASTKDFKNKGPRESTTSGESTMAGSRKCSK